MAHRTIKPRSPSAVVYDKWLDALGGGEVVACSIARILRDSGYHVTMVGGKAFDTRKIEKKLNINMDQIGFEWVWNDEYRLQNLAQNCDVFFNTSYMDYSHPSGKKSYYYTHFPTEAYLSWKGYIFNHIIAPAVTRWFQRCEFVTNKHEIMINGRYGYVLEKSNTLLLTHNSRSTRLMSFSLFYENYSDLLVRNTRVSVEHADILHFDIKMDPHHNILHYKLLIKPHSDTTTLKINVPTVPKTHVYPDDRVILLFPRTLPHHLLNTFVKRLLFRIETRMRAGIYVNVIKRLSGYRRVLSNSSFTSKWVQKYWKMKSDVLYPPVETLSRTPLRLKKKRICSIGRFFVLGHGKKQEVLVEAFKLLYDRGHSDWELHLIGSVDAQDKASMDFINKLRHDSEGHPIHFHINASRNEMQEIVSSSMIYWHATGFGENEDTDPIKFEHFGISTIEAMSAGCIPVLYKGGGLPEIVKTLGLSNQHLYTTIDQLVDKTIVFITHPNTYDSRLVCKRIDTHFSMNAFEKKLLKLIQS